MSNRLAQAYGLTMLAPIINGRTQGVHHAQELRTYLAGLPVAAGSPFARIPQVHTARWVVIDDLISEGRPGREDHLRSRYLLFVADVDGDLAAFVTSISATMPDVADAVWRHCVGYPGARDPRKLLAYVRDCQVKTTLYFGGYPGATVTNVLRALDAQRRMIDFIAETKGMPSGDLQAAFRQFRDDLEAAPTPAPASI